MEYESLLELVLTPIHPFKDDDLGAFLRGEDGSESRAIAASTGLDEPLGMLLNMARRANTRRLASASGLQAAIRRLFPNINAGTVAAFSISEDKGPHPKYINTSIVPAAGGGYLLNGTKRYASYSPLADLIMVCGSLGEADGRKQLRMVEVAADTSGLTMDPSPYLERFPGHPIADLMLTDVVVGKTALFEEDAYIYYIKPFRLIEDTLMTLALQIALTAALVRNPCQADDALLLERMSGLIIQGLHIAGSDFKAPAALLLVSDYLHQSASHWQTLCENWPHHTLSAEDWGQDTPLLTIGAAAREKRFSEAQTFFMTRPTERD